MQIIKEQREQLARLKQVYLGSILGFSVLEFCYWESSVSRGLVLVEKVFLLLMLMSLFSLKETAKDAS